MKFTSLSVIMILILASCSSDNKKRLPILGNREPVEKTVDGKLVTDTLYQTIPSFRFLNQDSVAFTDKDLDGKIYVTDFFFTSCPSICPVMHRNMMKVFQEYKGNDQVRIVSHTIDFKYDTPSKLKAYAKKLGAESDQWQFLWGNKNDVYNIAEKNYLVAVNEDKNAPGGYIHQGWFILVDKEKRLRGAYDGTKPDQVDQMIADMKTLLDEYKDQE
ncbi:SCO family protein [Desertivirga xinjiangensis]|uniref:SCO family protein n=1 Tax=Desertivirga xinjiangensis TaxID=539206 RepID=UPI00210C1AF0|nr:SCO family protein [Pedobacter xinjiangensis]